MKVGAFQIRSSSREAAVYFLIVLDGLVIAGALTRSIISIAGETMESNVR